MSDCYVLIKKLFSSEDISLILDKANNHRLALELRDNGILQKIIDNEIS